MEINKYLIITKQDIAIPQGLFFEESTKVDNDRYGYHGECSFETKEGCTVTVIVSANHALEDSKSFAVMPVIESVPWEYIKAGENI